MGSAEGIAQDKYQLGSHQLIILTQIKKNIFLFRVLYFTAKLARIKR